MSDTTELIESALESGFSGPGKYELVVRQDNPAIIHEEKPLKFSGVLDSPLVYLRQRIQSHIDKSANIVVDREAMSITLTTEERSDFRNVVAGSLTYHPSFLRLGINDGKFVTAKELADRLRKNKSFFDTIQDATEVITKLQTFKANVIEITEKSDNNRGNSVEHKERAIKSINIPTSFKLKTPIFKGQSDVELSVEVEIRADDLSVTLFSEEAFTSIDQTRDTAIDEVLKGIRELCPGIVILEK